jgi:hypothetical protein
LHGKILETAKGVETSALGVITGDIPRLTCPQKTGAKIAGRS